MSLFDRSKIDGNVFGDKKEFEDHPEGKFNATISKVDMKKTMAGHRVINLGLKTDKGMVFTGLNLDHPKCTTITQQNIAQILDSYQTPPAEVETVEQMQDLMSGLPVAVFIKNKGKNDKGYMQYGVYFNELPAESKVKLDGGAPVKRVEY